MNDNYIMPIKCVHEEFESRVAEAPDRIAIVEGNRTLSYGELNTRANVLAHHLLASPAFAHELVGVVGDRSADTIASILATLKAGRAYLALDPEYPAERLRLLARDSGAPVLDANVGGMDETATKDPRISARPSDLAYVTYTSGSSGMPKGALLQHEGLARLIAFTREQMQIGPGDRILQFASLSFDASVWEISCALTSGAALVLAPHETLAPGPELHRLMRARGVTIALLSPSVLGVLPADGLDDLRIVVAGTERCSEEIVRRWWTGGRRFFNAYGPTETTIYSTIYEAVTPRPGAPPIGRPVPGTTVHILDADLRPVPAGEEGELCIGGVGVARGYLNRPQLTAERFITTDDPEMPRVYRTGDRCRWSADGQLEYLGRLDRQLKLRGFRVEPGEIEAVLEAHDAVSSAVVVASTDERGDAALWAYVVGRAGCTPSSTQLLDYLRAHLPQYMIPVAIEILSQWPLTPHRKIDFQQLPIPRLRVRSEEGAPPAQWRDDVERRVGNLFASVLGDVMITSETNLFDVGFNSLDVARLQWKIHGEFHIALPYASVFLAGTVAAIADLVNAATASVHTPSVMCYQPAPRTGTPAHASPASLIQRDFYLFDVISGGSAGSIITEYLRVPRPLDRDRLRDAVRQIIERHEMLRTSFDERAGAIIQIVDTDIDALIDAAQLPVPSKPARVSFDVGSPPLWRLTVDEVGRDHHVLRLDISHMIADGDSVEIIKRDLLAAIGGRRLPPTAATTRDYALWQNSVASENVRNEVGAYWAQQLANLPKPVSLGGNADHGAPSYGRATVETTQLSAGEAERLRAAASERRLTAMMLSSAAFAVMMHTVWKCDDLVFGTVVSGRRFAELSDVVGPFLSLVPIRLRVDEEMTVDAFLEQVRARILEALSHQDFDFSAWYRRPGGPARGSSGLPFNVGFTLHTVRNRTTLQTYQDMAWPLDLNVEAVEYEGGVDLNWIYRRPAVSSLDIARGVELMRQVLSRLTDHSCRTVADLVAPAKVPSLTPGSIATGRSL